MYTPNDSIQTCGSPEVITSTTTMRNVVKNWLGKAKTQPENPNWAPILSKKKKIQLPWPSNLEQYQQGTLAIGWKSQFSCPR